MSIVSCAFWACHHLSHHYFLNFWLALHMHIRIRHDLPNFLLCWFLISGKLTAWFFNTFFIPGIKQKN